MVTDRIKKVLSAIVMSRYQNDDCFDIETSILKQCMSKDGKYIKQTTIIQINDTRFKLENIDNCFEYSDGMRFNFDNSDKLVTVADEDCYELLEFYKLSNNKYLVINGALNTVYSISTVEIAEFGNTVKFKIAKCHGDKYSVDPVSNFWLYTLAGFRKTPVNIYCIKSGKNGLWVVRKDWKTEIAFSKYYPAELRHTLCTENGIYTLYRFRGLKLASFSYKGKNNKVIENDVVLTESTIHESGQKYKRIQKGTKVFYI